MSKTMFQSVVAHAQGPSFGNTTTVVLMRIESFEYDPVKATLGVNLVSGRNHIIQDERAYPLYIELCDAYEIPEDLRSPKGTRPERNGKPSVLNDGVENPPPAVKGGTAIPPGLRRGAELGQREADKAPR